MGGGELAPGRPSRGHRRRRQPQLPLAHFRRLRHDLAATAVIDVREDGATVVRINDICHLEAESLAERGGYWAT